MKAVIAGATACAVAILVAAGTGIASEKSEAATEFDKAISTINAGRKAMRSGNNESAYCLFMEASMRLSSIKQRFPSWNTKAVERQIAAIRKMQGNVKATTCKILEGMDKDQYRFDTWQRQVLMLDKLNKIVNMLTYITREQDRNQEYIKDIRDRMDNLESR